MRRTLICFITFTLCLWTNIATAQDFPAPQSVYVNDFANIIDAQTKERITKDLTRFRTDTGTQFTVVTVQSLGDSPLSPPEYATALFNHWGVGDATRNTGILMLIALDEQEVFIALGSAYPPRFDDRMDRVFDQYMRSNFTRTDYAQGIEAGVLETIKRSKTDWIPEPKKRGSGMIVFILAVLGMGLLAFRNRLSDATQRFRKCPTCGTRTLTRTRNRTTAPTIGTKGVETRLTYCNQCDYRDERQRILPVKASKNSTGGFGGGRSSGGGGGGRW